MGNDDDRQSAIALAGTVADEAIGIANTLGMRLQSEEEKRDLVVHAERARNLYALICRTSGMPPLTAKGEFRDELTLTTLAVLTSAEFPIGGDYIAEAKLLGDADDGRALVVHVEVKSKTERFRAAWFSSSYDEIKNVVQEVTKLVDAGASLGTMPPQYVSRVGHLAMCVHNMGWRINYHNKNAVEA